MAYLHGPVAPGDTWRMEQFSRAYVKAIAAAAGCTYQRAGPDIDVVDVILKRATSTGLRRSPQLDVQLKSTYKDCVQGDQVAYALDIPTYDNLRATDFAVPRILVVVLMNPEFENWTKHSETELDLFRCGYWVSLKGQPAVSNSSTKTVYLPRIQVFDPTGLDGIFNRLANAQDP